ncbi:ketopantoate reductase family protein [Planococcus salinus]|uniref:2-dehydropantoate 2-reductase n=1 Tax=Planococcus salinus TaxID=1848460 RepID=A0A3M8PAE3_9BACL|nr:2-dehydropantoate 2-reductase [Planococcus salinus]RNF40685.1 2-dehydropantoate 2-reductase [Planococcus salinus]
MKVTVVGAGAVGMLTACLLEQTGAETLLVTRRDEQAKTINAQGIKKEDVVCKVKATANWNDIDPDSFILLAVKHSQLDEVMSLLETGFLSNPIVFLQNGMLHVEPAKNLPQEHIAVGSVEHGALKLSDCEVRHTGKGTIKFALLKGDENRFCPLLETEGFPCSWHGEADSLLFRKVLLNSLINPLTALMSIKNGELLTNPYAYELLKNLYKELGAAFPEMEVLLPFEEVAALCASTAQNTSSMLADKKAGRRLELDTIVLYTLQRSPVELPLLQGLYHLLKSAEV